MTEPITKQELIDASADAQTLEDVVNGTDVTDVTSRLARTYPTLAKALRLIVQNGLLGATAFNLGSQMVASSLVNGDYAVVTDDPNPEINGFYQKQDGLWEFLEWNPINQFLTALAAETSSRVAGDADNASAISAEQSTRTGQVATLTAQIGAEAATRASTDTTLQNNINAEQASRIAADSLNATTIATETTDRIAAITAESTARQSADAAINAELDAETASRVSADSGLQSQITAEAATRSAADATNAAAIATEATNRANADTTLQTNLTAEAATRATADSTEQAARVAADNALSDLIDDESTARIAADNTLQSNITAEASTRASADTANANAIAAESSTRAGQITTLNADFAAAISDEEDARIAGDVANVAAVSAEATARATAITTEASARIAGDNANSVAIAAESSNRATAITAESTARVTANNALQANISAEQSARIASDSANTAAINAESTARQAADAAINAELDAETASRISADSGLQSQITVEASTRAAADATNAAAIATETTNRTNADTTLQANINSEASTRASADSVEQAARIAANANLQSQVTAEVSARTSGDAANTTAIDNEQAARIAGDNALQTNLDTESAARIAADATLQSGVDANTTAIATETTDRIAADTAESTTRTEQVGLINAALSKIFGAVRFDGYHDDFGNKYLFAILGAGSKVGFGITNKLKVLWGGNQLVLDRMIGIKDSAGRYALAVTKSGKIYAPNLVLPAWVTATLTSLATADSTEQAARIAADATLTTAQNATASSLTTLAANFSIGVSVYDDSGNKYLLALINKTSGRIAWGITRKAELMIGGAKVKNSRLPFIVRDPSGLIAFAVTAKGTVHAPNLVLTSKQLAQIPSNSKTSMLLQSLVKTQVMHVVGDGQSLSVGSFTADSISTTQPYNNIMFTSGVTKAIGDGSYSAAAFVPLIESNGVESPTAGALNGFVRRVVSAGGVASEYVMLGTQAGVGGQRITALTDEALYVRLRRQITDAKAVAVANGQTYSVAAITWIQGEADISGALWTRAIDYYQRYLALMTKIRNDALTASGQDYLPTIYSYQTSAHMYYNKRYLGIAIAQWRASVERKDICLATPAYRLPTAADNLHLSNEGSWLLGEYIARAMYWTMIKGQKWRPLEPIEVTWTATHIDVKYHVPCKPIQLSTVICNAATNQGFDIWTNGSVYDSGATSNDDTLLSTAIDTVTVVSDDTIRITFNGAVTIPADAVLSYGRGRSGDSQTSGSVTGARGNVVDSHGLYDIVSSPLANNFALYNVGVYFEHGRKNGFF